MEFNVLFWLMTKHIIADYYMQYPWMYKYKGTYGHPGGISHSIWHGVLTIAVLFGIASAGLLTDVSYMMFILLGVLDAVAHYHIDYVKSNSWKRWPCTPSDQLFWIIHGTDQLAHGLTYFLIVHLLAHGHV